jgi:hypothetical protein
MALKSMEQSFGAPMAQTRLAVLLHIVDNG